MSEPQEPLYELPTDAEVHPVAKQIVEDFVADVRKLSVIFGSQARLANALRVSPRSIERWFMGDGMPLFGSYLAVKCLLDDMIKQAQKEFEFEKSITTPKRTTSE